MFYWLFYFITVLQCQSITVLQYQSITVLQCQSITVLQYQSITVLQCQSITVLQWLCGPAMPFCCDTKTVHRLLPCSPPLWHVSSIWWYWYINIDILILILICQYYYIEIDILWASLDNCFSTTPHSSGAIQLVPKIKLNSDFCQRSSFHSSVF